MELEDTPGTFLKRVHRSDIRTLDSDVSIISSLGNKSFGATSSSASSSVLASSSVNGGAVNVVRSDKGGGSSIATDNDRCHHKSLTSANAPGGDDSDDSDNDSENEAIGGVGSNAREAHASSSPNMMPPLGLWLDSVRLGSFVVQLRSLPGGGVATLTQLLALQAHEVKLPCCFIRIVFSD